MTINGEHTAHELSDLWAAYAFERTKLWDAFTAATSDWRAADPAGYARFSVGQTMLDARVAAMMPRIQAFADVPEDDSLTGWDYRVVRDLHGDVFDDLVAAWGAQSSTGALGFDDLDRLMRTTPAVAKYVPDYSGIPQPTAPDLDLDAYKLADAATKAVEKAAKIGGGGLLVVGLVVLGVALAVRR